MAPPRPHGWAPLLLSEGLTQEPAILHPCTVGSCINGMLELELDGSIRLHPNPEKPTIYSSPSFSRMRGPLGWIVQFMGPYNSMGPCLLSGLLLLGFRQSIH